jgi:hypothetical protein
MISVYINYPNPHITIHKAQACGNIRPHDKEGQRKITINENSISKELLRFSEKDYRFSSNVEQNDMWLVVDLENDSAEAQAVEDVRKHLAHHYTPFGRVKVDVHCD